MGNSGDKGEGADLRGQGREGRQGRGGRQACCRFSVPASPPQVRRKSAASLPQVRRKSAASPPQVCRKSLP
jgi:hypothetical protein